MAIHKYTVTTTTVRCPHCGHILYEWSKGGCTPIIAVCWPVTLPAMLPYLAIKHWGFGNPTIPTVGEEVIPCPKCSLPVRTVDLKMEHMNPVQLLNFKFQSWFRVAYVLGALFSFSLILWVLGAASESVVFCALAAIAFVGIGVIIATYRIMLARAYMPKQKSIKSITRWKPKDKEHCIAGSVENRFR